MKQSFHKIESDYSMEQLNNVIIALSHWIDYLESHTIDRIDKHLIKDLRRHKDRLLNLRKMQEIIK
jgi:hypothetical protein